MQNIERFEKLSQSDLIEIAKKQMGINDVAIDSNKLNIGDQLDSKSNDSFFSFAGSLKFQTIILIIFTIIVIILLYFWKPTFLNKCSKQDDVQQQLPMCQINGKCP